MAIALAWLFGLMLVVTGIVAITRAVRAAQKRAFLPAVAWLVLGGGCLSMAGSCYALISILGPAGGASPARTTSSSRTPPGSCAKRER